MNHRRLPILLWGDLREGAAPVLRRAVAGYRAHECMYAWVYLTEHLAHVRLQRMLQGMDQESRRRLFAALDADLWRTQDRAAVDPHWQLSRDAFEAVAAVACIAAAAGEPAPTIVELGSTFFTARTKFATLCDVASASIDGWPAIRPRWIGIDNSPFMHDTASLLHRDKNLELLASHADLANPPGFSVLLSRFVASYAFGSSAEFAQYVSERFDAMVIEDAHAISERDVRTWNHGQAEVFFSIPDTLGALERAGFEIHLLGSYPDFPAGAAPCHVVRYIACKPGALVMAADHLQRLGFRRPSRIRAAELLATLNAGVSSTDWRMVERAKQESPVWGPTTLPQPAFLHRVASALRTWTRCGRWTDYRLAGPAVLREVRRALERDA